MPKSHEPRRTPRERKLKHESMDVNAIINSPHFDYLMSEAQRRLDGELGGLGPGDSREARASRRLARHGDPASPDPAGLSPGPADASAKAPRPHSHPLETDQEEEIHIEKRITRKRRSANSAASLLDVPGTPPTPLAGLPDDDSSRDMLYSEDRRASLRSRSRIPKAEDGVGPEDPDQDPDEGSSDEDEPSGRRYSLREHRTAVDRYAVPEPKPTPKPHSHDRSRRDRTPTRPRSNKVAFLSPAHRRRERRRRMTSGRSHDRRSSSTSSDGSGDDDDARFERRKVKSLDRAREKFLPSNLDPKDARRGVLGDRMRAVGGSCTDVDPMEIDRSVKFDQVGGLAHHIQALKEMVIFPMVYPEVFAKFKLAPPRGVIFYGPPGTGKTLVARALSNECSKGDKKVSFFMRKGADCLSKWVGESERQLRLLFDQAYTMRPSIIFFDELDGIAPVRSSRQDQIHSSIVSTLLALMDGLDARGEVVVIGATNRLDALDPALRRPGRFDRELRFALPDRSARRDILAIATKEWDPPLSPELLDSVAERTVGYCGADMKGVCTEAALVSLRHRYPQIYLAEEKLQLDLNAIRVGIEDFEVALRKLTPSSRRDFSIQTRPVAESLMPLLGKVFDDLIERKVPPGYLPAPPASSQAGSSKDFATILQALQRPKAVQGCRLLVTAPSGAFGQTSHLAPALLHAMDHLQVHSLAIPNIYSESSSRSAEEAVAGVLRAAARAGSTGPTVLFLPAVEEWQRVVPVTVWHTLTAALDSWDALTSIFFLVTAHEPLEGLSPDIQGLFRRQETFAMALPSETERRRFFSQLLVLEAGRAPSSEGPVLYPDLPIVPRVSEEDKLRKLSDAEKKVLRRVEEGTLRELRTFLRDVLARLIRDRRFALFAKPVDPEEAPDYNDVIANPMDLGRMMEKIDLHHYSSPDHFLQDIDLITENALQYNPDNELHPSAGGKKSGQNKASFSAALKDRSIRHRACALRDAAYGILEEDLDPEFERRLKDVLESMRKRGAAVPGPPAFITSNSRPADGRDEEGNPRRYSTRSHGPAQSLQLEDVFGASLRGIVAPRTARDDVDLSPDRPSTSREPRRAAGEEEGEARSAEWRRKRSQRARGNPFCLPKRRRHSQSAEKRAVLSRHSNAILRKYRKRLQPSASNASSRLDVRSQEGSSSNSPRSTPASPQASGDSPADASPAQPQTLVVDEAQLNAVLKAAVAKTADWPLLPLHRLYADLAAELDAWKERWDRTDLPQALARIVADATQH